MISVKSTIGCNSLSYSSNIAMITSIILNINDRMSEHMSDRIPEMWDRMSERMPKNIWLVVSTSEKYESQLGLLFPIYGKIQFMFQTTNQTSNHSLNPPQRSFQNRAATPWWVPSTNPWPQRQSADPWPPPKARPENLGIFLGKMVDSREKSRMFLGKNGKKNGKMMNFPREIGVFGGKSPGKMVV